MNEYEHRFLIELEAFRERCELSISDFCEKLGIYRSTYWRWMQQWKVPKDKICYITLKISTIVRLKELGFEVVSEKQKHYEGFEQYLNDNNKAGEFFRALKYKLHYCDT